MAKKSKNSKLLVHYTRTMTPENLSKAANYVGEYVLKGLGALGKIFTAPLTGGPLGPATVVLPKTKELLDAERKLRETQEELIGKVMTWVSPLNYGAALMTGNGLNAKKGEEEVASWSPAWQAAARLGELYVGPKAVKGVKATPRAVVNTAAKAGVKPAKAAVVAREIKLATKNRPNLSNRTISINRENNAVTNSPDVTYTLYNEFGEPIGKTNVGYPLSGNSKSRMVEGVMSKNNGHKISEDTYNQAVLDILDNGGEGLESGWSLMMPLRTLPVTSKFPHTVIGLQFGNPVRLLTGTTKRPILRIVKGNHYIDSTPQLEWIDWESETPHYKVSITEEPSTSLAFFERKPAKISEAEKAGVPKGERNNVNNSGNLERTVNNIILENEYWLPKETGMFAQKHSSIGSNYRKTFERLWGKENTDRLTDDLLGKLILIRNHLIDTNIPLKGDFVYVVDGQAKAYRNGLEIGYLSNSYINNGKALHPEMVKKQGTNNAGVSELLYNGTILAENRPIISGSRLLMPEVTTHIWSKYPTRKLISTEGVHAWPLRTAQERGIKLNYEKNWHTLPEFSKLHQLALDENIRTNLIGLPIYELSEPSYLPMVKNARVFDISLLRDGYINLDFTPGFAYKQGGKMNILEFLKNGSGIHIKKKNRGKFTSYCGGKVTDECIRKAKSSGNLTLVKRATFALNARRWKHKEGGIIKAGDGLSTSLLGLLPGVGTYLDYKEFERNPNWRTGISLGISALGDATMLTGAGALIKGISAANKARKILGTAGKAANVARLQAWNQASKLKRESDAVNSLTLMGAPTNKILERLASKNLAKKSYEEALKNDEAALKVYLTAANSPAFNFNSSQFAPLIYTNPGFHTVSLTIKHKDGGIIKAGFGLKLSNTVNKIGDFFNSNTGKGLLNLGMLAFGTIKGSIDANNYSNSFDAETNSLLKAMDASQRKNNYKLASQLASEIIKLKQLENPDIHYGPIDKLLLENQIADSLYDDSEMVKYQVLRALEKLKLMEAIQGSSSGILDTVGGLLGNFMGNKKDTSPNTSSNNSTFGNYVSTLFKNYGTFNSDGSFNTSLGTYKWEDGKIKNISNTYGTFNADGSMNLGGLLGTISINGGYKPRKFGTLMNYT